MAHIVRKPTGDYRGGIESTLNVFGKIILIASFVAAIAAFYIAGEITKDSVFDAWGEEGFSPTWLAVALWLPVQGFALFLLFGWAAQTVCLLKKIAGLPCGIKISEARQHVSLVCSQCGQKVEEYFRQCPSCGVPLVGVVSGQEA